MNVAPRLEPVDGGVRVRVKVVPGASRSAVAGWLGERLKVLVTAPPEGGRANRAVCEVLAGVFGVPKRAVSVADGAGQPRKTIVVQGISAAEALRCLEAAGGVMVSGLG